MKLSKSKLALAKVINENGGWVDDSAYAANDEGGIICGYSSKPNRSKLTSYFWSGGQRNTWIRGIKTPQWHQCVLSREEYYHAYPKADADGWIEWKGGECPVGKGTLVDVKYANGIINFGVSAMTNRSDANHVPGTAVSFTASNWGGELPLSGIIAYRLHKPDVKPEFCESVTRSIPEPEAKPTIEQLAQDYRNKLDHANRKQQEAGDARAAADAALVELELAGEAAGLLVSPIREDVKPQLTITEWRELKIGDEVKYISGTADECNGMVGAICKIDGRPECGRYRIKVLFDKISRWCDRWEFIRRP